MRIMMAGDTHGSLPWTLHLLDKALFFEANLIFVLGDFGYWPRFGDGRDFIYKLEHQLKKNCMPLAWIDGNHEDHDELDKLIGDGDEAVDITDHITFMPRGYGWNWDSKRFVALGGATSIDMDLRTPGKTWFPQEDITDEQVKRAKNNGYANVLLTHDAPLGTTLDITMPSSFTKESPSRRAEIEAKARVNRGLIADVANYLDVDYIFHGHHHTAYRSQIKLDDKWLTVEGLACHQMNGAWTIFDTEA